MLTPQDIDKKVFKRAMRGYEIADVEEFLQELGQDYEELYRENLAAKERVAMLSEAVQKYKAMEETLQNALEVARRNGEDIEELAQGQAERVMESARLQAKAMIDKASAEVATIKLRQEEMKRENEVFCGKMIELLHAQLDSIKSYREIPERDEESRRLSLSEQPTAEIPALIQNEKGEYLPAEEK